MDDTKSPCSIVYINRFDSFFPDIFEALGLNHAGRRFEV